MQRCKKAISSYNPGNYFDEVVAPEKQEECIAQEMALAQEIRSLVQYKPHEAEARLKAIIKKYTSNN